MAVGDQVEDFVSLDDDDTLDIRPSAGFEWTVHLIVVGDECELNWENSDASEIAAFETSPAGSPHAWVNYRWPVSNDTWLQVKNVSGNTIFVSYKGVQTK